MAEAQPEVSRTVTADATNDVEGVDRSPAQGQEHRAPPPALSASKVAPEVQGGSEEAGDMTCAICLEEILVEDLCVVKGCEHIYCGKCILAWTVHKEPAWCPQCKVPFSELLTYRKLDGTMSDFPVEESVCLLKRSHWFTAHLKEVEKGKAALPPLTTHQQQIGAEPDARDWADWQDAVERAHYDRFEAEFEDDDEVEAFYFSAAAGRARITLGNRRFGEGGFMAAGRQQARPVAPARSGQGKGKAAASAPSTDGQVQQGRAASHKAAAPGTACGAPDEPATPARAAPGRAAGGRGSKGQFSDCDTTPGSDGSGGGGSSSAGKGKSGRRARRKEKQASADARAALLSSP